MIVAFCQGWSRSNRGSFLRQPLGDVSLLIRRVAVSVLTAAGVPAHRGRPASGTRRSRRRGGRRPQSDVDAPATPGDASRNRCRAPDSLLDPPTSPGRSSTPRTAPSAGNSTSTPRCGITCMNLRRVWRLWPRSAQGAVRRVLQGSRRSTRLPVRHRHPPRAAPRPGRTSASCGCSAGTSQSLTCPTSRVRAFRGTGQGGRRPVGVDAGCPSQQLVGPDGSATSRIECARPGEAVWEPTIPISSLKQAARGN